MKKYMIILAIMLFAISGLFADRVQGTLIAHFANNDCGGTILVEQILDPDNSTIVNTINFPPNVGEFTIYNDIWDLNHFYFNEHTYMVNLFFNPVGYNSEIRKQININLDETVDYEVYVAFYKQPYMKSVSFITTSPIEPNYIHVFDTSYFTLTGEIMTQYPGIGGGEPEDYGIKFIIVDPNNNEQNIIVKPCTEWDEWTEFTIEYNEQYCDKDFFLDSGATSIIAFGIWPSNCERYFGTRNLKLNFEYVPDITNMGLCSYNTSGNEWHPKVSWNHSGFPTNWLNYFNVEIWRKQFRYGAPNVNWKKIADCNVSNDEYIDTELTSPSGNPHGIFAVYGIAHYKIILRQNTSNPNWDFCTLFPNDEEWNDTFTFSNEKHIYYGKNCGGQIQARGSDGPFIQDVIVNNAVISFNIKDEQNLNTEIKLYNIKGQLVKRIFNNKLNKGKHKIKWNGLDNNNKSISNGIYFYRITRGKLDMIKKSIVLE